MFMSMFGRLGEGIAYQLILDAAARRATSTANGEHVISYEGSGVDWELLESM
jgi:hypothetical protein